MRDGERTKKEPQAPKEDVKNGMRNDSLNTNIYRRRK